MSESGWEYRAIRALNALSSVVLLGTGVAIGRVAVEHYQDGTSSILEGTLEVVALGIIAGLLYFAIPAARGKLPE